MQEQLPRVRGGALVIRQSRRGIQRSPCSPQTERDPAGCVAAFACFANIISFAASLRTQREIFFIEHMNQAAEKTRLRLVTRPAWLEHLQPRTPWQRFCYEFLLFGIKQGWACLFAGLLLAVIIITQFWYPLESLHRYDFLFLFAVTVQVALLALRLETPREAMVIVIFHLVATGMELFKTLPSIGSWIYPDPSVIKLWNVPLFAGFMYSAVGSYFARIWRVFHFKFSYFPSRGSALALAVLIYVNFFTHHYIRDFRWLLIVASLLLFGRSRIYFTIDHAARSMPLVLGFTLVAIFIWLAENIATFCRVWLYPSQINGWHAVSPQKIVAWYLLMLISFVLVALVNLPQTTAAGKKTGDTLPLGENPRSVRGFKG
jgi:uncharacterized membrane protein YoaT (DUF817 family)